MRFLFGIPLFGDLIIYQIDFPYKPVFCGISQRALFGSHRGWQTWLTMGGTFLLGGRRNILSAATARIVDTMKAL